MMFADIFISSLNINISELELKDRFLLRSISCVQTSVYPLSAVTEVAGLILKCTLTDGPPHQLL
jgi:hypothetical protein